MGVLIFCVTPYYIFAIWLCICILHVSEVQWRNFLIVESLYTMIFSAISPFAWSECTPITAGSIPLSYSLRRFALVLTALTMSMLVT